MKTFHETLKKCMHNNTLIFLLNFPHLPRKQKDLCKQHTHKKCVSLSSTMSVWTFTVEHQVYLHAMHITCNRTMIIPAVSSQLFYNVKGFRDNVVIFMLFCRNLNGLHVHLTNSALRHKYRNYYIFCTNSFYNSLGFFLIEPGEVR